MSGDWDELADSYLHGLLSPEETAQFERRLEQEPRLHEALGKARRRLALIESALPPAESSEALVRSTLARVDRADRQRYVRRRRLAGWFMAPIAAAVLILGLFHYRFANLAASPISLDVYGQEVWMPGSEAAMHVRLVNRRTGHPVAGVPVFVELRAPDSNNFTPLAEVQTDANGHGSPMFRLPDWNNGVYEVRVRALLAEGAEEFVRPVRLQRSLRLFLSTDKPRYLPGQTIHVRGLALQQRDSRPVAGQKARFILTGPDGQILQQSVQETNRFGLAAVDFALPATVTPGRYRIACTVDETTSEVTVAIEHYTLPKVRVTISTDKTWYRPGDEAVVMVEGKHFDGSPAAGEPASLEISLPGNATPIFQQKKLLDADGRARFRYQTPRYSGHHPSRFTSRVGVPRPVGQVSITVAISEQPMIIAVSSFGGAQPRDLPRRTAITLRMPDGEPVKTRGQLKSGNRSYPFETDEAGNAALDVIPPIDNDLVQISATAPDGSRVEQSMPLTAAVALAQVILQTDRRVYRAGSTMHIEALGPDGPLYLDFRRDGYTHRSATIDIRNGRAESAFDIPAELHGSWTIVALRAVQRFEPAARVQVKVEPANALRIRAEFDRGEYQPGDTARVRLSLADANDQPTPGAFSVAVVNEAVFFSWTADGVGDSGGDFSWSGDTYIAKQAATTELREKRLELVGAGWIGLGAFVAVALYAWLWASVRTRYVLILHGVVGAIFLCGGVGYLLVSLFESKQANQQEALRQSVADAPARGKSASPPAASPPRTEDPKSPSTSTVDGTTPTETLLWRPIVVTDESGNTDLVIPLADFPTTWRLSAQAVTGDGQVADIEKRIRVLNQVK